MLNVEKVRGEWPLMRGHLHGGAEGYLLHLEALELALCEGTEPWGEQYWRLSTGNKRLFIVIPGSPPDIYLKSEVDWVKVRRRIEEHLRKDKDFLETVGTSLLEENRVKIALS